MSNNIIEEETASLQNVTINPIDETLEGETINTQSPNDASIRIHVSLLDSLMTLAGELVLSRNQLLQSISAQGIKGAEAVGQRIDLITSELQEAIMLTRMQPIDNAFKKIPRVVRDLSDQLDKQIELNILGKDVEIDKTIIEAINDPLTHLIRNAVDHGIEPTEVRRKTGKPDRGKVTIRAFHEAGQVVIKIEDDGKGIDGDALVALAVKAGLVSVEQAQAMPDKEKIGLIFQPGLSTAREITNVSGRGVGMDVVKSSLDKLGGQIEITSDLGSGTAFSMKLPLTLAIIPCQVVTTEGERYAIPQANLEELVRIPAHQVKDRIEIVGNAEVVRLRDNLLPLVRLADVLGINRTYRASADGKVKSERRQLIADRRSQRSPALTNERGAPLTKSPTRETVDRERTIGDRRKAAESALNIVVVSAGALTYGLIIDQLQDSEEIVIKPLGRHLQNCQGYAGATIMGDGRIALILDINNLARMAQLTSVDGEDKGAGITSQGVALNSDSRSALVFRSSAKEQFCVHLDRVERIEQVRTKDIEILGKKRVMQYRGGSLTLITIDDVATVQPIQDRDNLLVIVFSMESRSIGLLVNGPIDTREIPLHVDDETLKQYGISGSTIINKQTTMLIDIDEIVSEYQS